MVYLSKNKRWILGGKGEDWQNHFFQKGIAMKCSPLWVDGYDNNVKTLEVFIKNDTESPYSTCTILWQEPLHKLGLRSFFFAMIRLYIRASQFPIPSSSEKTSIKTSWMFPNFSISYSKGFLQRKSDCIFLLDENKRMHGRPILNKWPRIVLLSLWHPRILLQFLLFNLLSTKFTGKNHFIMGQKSDNLSLLLHGWGPSWKG